MFYCIKGTLIALNADFAVLDCNGVGFKLYISQNTHEKLAPRLKGEANLYTYLSVREDALELFGFYTEDEKELFVLLIGVSGIGPKAAVSVLSALSPEKLISAVLSDDAKAISRAPGIGIKKAQKVILELKDKLQKLYTASGEITVEDSSPLSSSMPAGLDDAVAALTALGYTRADINYALKGVNTSAPTEAIIRNALAKLSGR